MAQVVAAQAGADVLSKALEIGMKSKYLIW